MSDGSGSREGWMHAVVMTSGTHSLRYGMAGGYPSFQQPKLKSQLHSLFGGAVLPTTTTADTKSAAAAAAAVEEALWVLPAVLIDLISEYADHHSDMSHERAMLYRYSIPDGKNQRLVAIGADAFTAAAKYPKPPASAFTDPKSVNYNGANGWGGVGAGEMRSVFRSDGFDALAFELATTELFYTRMKLPAEDYPVLMSLPTSQHTSRSQRLEILMETFAPPAVCFQADAVLALYSTGRYQGLVVDAGYSQTSVTSVFNGQEIQRVESETLNASAMEGRFISDIESRYGHATQPFSRSFFEQLKEQIATVSHAPTGAYPPTDPPPPKPATERSRTYKLPDGESFQVKWTDADATDVLEPYFRPYLLGVEEKSLPQMIADCVARNDPSFRNELYRAVILTGGGMAAPGMGERICSELSWLESPRSVSLFNTVRPTNIVDSSQAIIFGTKTDAIVKQNALSHAIRVDSVRCGVDPIDRSRRDTLQVYRETQIRPQDMTYVLVCAAATD